MKDWKDSISPPVEICKTTSGRDMLDKKMKIVTETRQEEEKQTENCNWQEEENRSKELFR